MSSCMLLLAFAFSLVKDIPYDSTLGNEGLGDLYVPERSRETTPIVLLIHGGGWYNGSRPNMAGIAEYFAKDLGFAVYNIEYRTVENGSHWPACGVDCVKAAEFLLSSGFKSEHGFAYDKIWICGGSAGGHLALWTLVNLPTDKVAGAVAISPIGDPVPDYATHQSRYTQLFEGEVDLAALDPCTRITSGMAPLLITHAIDDTVVPVQSSRNFASAYAAAGNSVESFEYANDIEPNQEGHCIWRPDLTPHKLIASLEQRISNFVRANSATDPVSPGGEISSRTMRIVAVNRSLVGSVSSVDLSFGAGNGLSNRLYVAYGDAYGGDRRGDWEHSQFVATIPDDIATYRAYVPTGAKVMRFYLDVPFPGGGLGEPVKWISANGTQYIDTGVYLKNGDVLTARFRPEAAKMAVMGYRRGAAQYDNVNVVLSDTKVVAFYSASSAYADYWLSGTKYTLNTWYDVRLAPEERSFTEVATGAVLCKNDVKNTDTFKASLPCRLFHVAGAPSVTQMTVGSVSAFRIERDGTALASYLPYKVDGTYGFYDRVTGGFFAAEEEGTAFSGEDDATLSTPLTSATETIASGKPTVEMSARAITSCTAVKVGDREYLDLSFGPDNGADNLLYLAFDQRDRGTDYRNWANVVKIGVVSAATNAWRVAVPDGAKKCRFFLSLPVDGEGIPVAVKYVSGDGASGYFDTGMKVKGGDEISLKVRFSDNAISRQIFGCRSNGGNAWDRNLSIFTSGSRMFLIDYTNTSADHRCTGTVAASANVWYDVTATPARRAVCVSETGVEVAATDVRCDDEFTTAYTAYLFRLSGGQPVAGKLNGDVGSLTIKRNGAYELSWHPCVLGSEVGFYDRAGGKFVPAEEGTFTAGEVVEESPLVSVSAAVSVNKTGLMLLFR